jgi:hypothetical protein
MIAGWIIYQSDVLFSSLKQNKTEFSEVGQKHLLTITMYNATPGQCDGDPYLTAGLYKIDPNNATEQRYVAVSRDLLVRWGGSWNYGDYIQITGTDKKDGIYKIVDTMNKRIKNTIDILETKGTKLYKFNKISVVKVEQVNF